jgi:hypothetical protein
VIDQSLCHRAITAAGSQQIVVYIYAETLLAGPRITPSQADKYHGYDDAGEDDP